MQHETQFMSLNGHNLAYITAGNPEKPPLVMIHGMMSHKLIWRTTIPAVKDDFFCFAPDLLGLAESDKPTDGDYSIPAQAKRVMAMVDSLGIDKFCLMGHSMGGQISLEIAANIAPDRVIKLIHVDGVVSGKLSKYLRYGVVPRLWIGRWIPVGFAITRYYLTHSKPLARLEMGRIFFHDIDAIPYEDWELDREFEIPQGKGRHVSLIRAMQGMLGRDLTPDLGKITAPTLTIWGKQDKFVPVSEGELLMQHVSGAKIAWIDQCSHHPMLEKPGEYLEATSAFLAE